MPLLPDLYILNDKNEKVLEPDIRKWIGWMDNTTSEKRILAKSDINTRQKFVITVFMGIDQSLNNSNHYWKTSVFRFENGRIGVLTGEFFYTTFDDALSGHEKICKEIVEGNEKED